MNDVASGARRGGGHNTQQSIMYRTTAEDLGEEGDSKAVDFGEGQKQCQSLVPLSELRRGNERFQRPRLIGGSVVEARHLLGRPWNQSNEATVFSTSSLTDGD